MINNPNVIKEVIIQIKYTTKEQLQKAAELADKEESKGDIYEGT